MVSTAPIETLEGLLNLVGHREDIARSVNRSRIALQIASLLQDPAPRLELLSCAVDWSPYLIAVDPSDELAGELGFLRLLASYVRFSAPASDTRPSPSGDPAVIISDPIVQRYLTRWYTPGPGDPWPAAAEPSATFTVDPPTGALYEVDQRQRFVDVLQLPLDRTTARRVLPHLGDDSGWNARILRQVDSGQLEDEVLHALQVADPPTTALTRFAVASDQLVDATSSDALAGLVGFTSLILKVEAAARYVPDTYDLATQQETALRRDVNRLLAVPAVRREIEHWYGLPSAPDGFGVDLSAAQLHKVGTTSFILDCHQAPLEGAGRSRIALKCLIPRYAAVDSIAHETAAYKSQYDLLPREYAPEVFASGPRFIAMSFVRGDTLAEFLSQRRSRRRARTTPDAPEDEPLLDLPFLENLVTALCEKLGSAADTSAPGDAPNLREAIYHLDLSPSNIILPNPRDPGQLVIVDWGQNYLLRERVGTNAAFRRAASYIAPEVQSGDTAGPRADLYSVAIIILEIMSGEPLTDFDLPVYLQRLWERAPGVARLIEDLLDTSPDNRLALRPPGGARTDYDYVAEVVREEVKVLDVFDISEAPEGEGFRTLSFVALHSLRWPQIRQLKKVADKFRTDSPLDETYAEYGKLAGWARACYASWIIIFIPAFVLTCVDLGVKTIPSKVTHVLKATHAELVPGQFAANLPARLVLWSVAVICTTYYMNIFATLATSHIRLRIVRLASLWARWTPVLFVLPSLVAILYDPRIWTICAITCGLIVVVNNLLWLAVAAITQQTAHERFASQRDRSREFVESYFKEWPTLMFFYCVAISVIAYLLLSGHAHDTLVYATAIAVIDIAKMYRINCTRDAPRVRGTFERCLFLIRRMERNPRMGSALGGFDSMSGVLRVLLGVLFPERHRRRSTPRTAHVTRVESLPSADRR